MTYACTGFGIATVSLADETYILTLLDGQSPENCSSVCNASCGWLRNLPRHELPNASFSQTLIRPFNILLIHISGHAQSLLSLSDEHVDLSDILYDLFESSNNPHNASAYRTSPYGGLRRYYRAFLQSAGLELNTRVFQQD